MGGSTPARLLAIDDSALYTGREVKRLVQELQSEATRVRWVGIEEAAAALGVKQGTLRARAARWSRMQDPPIRVRKMGPGEGSHWLFEEAGLYALARRTIVTAVPAEPHPQAAGGESEEELTKRWCERVTQNL